MPGLGLSDLGGNSVKHHRLFAAGLAAALMLGAASPALADGKGKAKGKPNHGSSKVKPAPKPKKPKKNVGITGGGTVTKGSFSIQAKPGSKAKGHFNFTTPDDTTTVADESVRTRCKGFKGYVAPTDPAPYTATATFTNCKVNGVTAADVTVTVTDAPDHITVVSMGVDENLIEGNVKIRK
jgi:hypothetical protein